MPLYEYKCSKCNQVFEVLQRYSDAPVKVHEGCGGKVARLLTAPTFHFKGSGFYITDYANKHNSGSSAESSSTDSANGNGTAKTATPATPSAPSAASTASTASKPAPAASTPDK